MVSRLKTKFQTRLILLTSVPPMHRFPALPQPLRWWPGERAKKLNRIMQDVVQDDPVCRFVSVISPAGNGYAAADGFHPSGAAYALWAAHVAEIIDSEPKLFTHKNR